VRSRLDGRVAPMVTIIVDPKERDAGQKQ